LSAAFLPVLISIPLALGYLMITLATGVDCTKAPPSWQDAGVCDGIGDFFAGINDWWTLLWTCLALGVTWIGFFYILKQDETFGRIGETFQRLGAGWLRMPLHMPFVPTIDRSGNVKLKSPEQLGVSNVLQGINNFGRKPGTGGAAAAAPATLNTASLNKLNEAATTFQKASGTLDERIKGSASEFRQLGREFRGQLRNQGTQEPADQRIVFNNYWKDKNQNENLNLNDQHIKQIVDEMMQS
jgi:hypothetical protein